MKKPLTLQLILFSIFDCQKKDAGPACDAICCIGLPKLDFEPKDTTSGKCLVRFTLKK